MKMTQLFLSELEREAQRSRRSLEQVPADKAAWKPHDRSMAFGPLVQLVATMPSWFALIIKQDELDVAPKDGPQHKPAPMNTSAELIAGLDQAVKDAQVALEATTDEHLMTPWRLLAAGNVVMEAPRHVMLRDAMNHLAHHRGQMTVYLRLMGATVPALYGPSADDPRFM
ncbi:MAG: DinB family protein [Vicinamibacterales bacterium]